MYNRISIVSKVAAAVVALGVSGLFAAPASAKNHQGEVPEQHQHRQNGKSQQKPAAKSGQQAKGRNGADDPAGHNANEDHARGGRQKDDPAGHK